MRSSPLFAIAAALAMSAPAVHGTRTHPIQDFPTHAPDNRGRNKEKGALRIAKAGAKRERKLLKRKSK